LSFALNAVELSIIAAVSIRAPVAVSVIDVRLTLSTHLTKLTL